MGLQKLVALQGIALLGGQDKVNVSRPFNNEIVVVNNFLYDDEIKSVFLCVDMNKKINDKNSISSEYFNNRLIQLPTKNNIKDLFSDEIIKNDALQYLKNKENFILRADKILKQISDKNFFFTSIEALICSENKGMPAHFDDSPENNKTKTHYGMVLYLNDNYDGGEIYYPKLNLQYKPKRGDLIIHPGTEEYMHGVKDISNGNRYVITFFACTERKSSL